MKALIVVAVVAVLGIIAGTIFVGTQVREDTVVVRPYEEGLRHDADRRDRLASGWSVAVLAVPPAGAAGPLRFAVRAPGGAPVPGAEVALTASRPATSRGQLRAAARVTGAAYAADLAFPEPGPWDVVFDVRRGEVHVPLEARVEVPAGGGGCDLSATPCTLPLAGGGDVTLELAPRPLRTTQDLAVTATVRGDGSAAEGAAVRVGFAMRGMDMGSNVSALAPAGPGRFAGRAVLVRCPSGRKDWDATVTVERPGAPPRSVTFPLRVAE